MTVTDPPTTTWDDEPDDLLDQQAQEYGTPRRPSGRQRPAGHQAPPHDLDAERAALGAMILSLNACDTAIEAGLSADDFYSPFHSATFTTIVACLAAAEKPDVIAVRGRLPELYTSKASDLIAMQGAGQLYTNIRAYVTRVISCARARRMQGQALEVARAAQTGDLDGALARLAELTDSLPTDDTDTSWAPVDLAQVIDAGGPPPPTMLARDDGLCLLYDGKVHAFNAESESGKSWLALWACTERLAADEHVVYLDFEDSPADIVARLVALGCDHHDIIERFHYIRPDDPIDAVATAALERILVEHRPRLCIVDGVTEVMVMNGWEINSNDDSARFLHALPKRIARHGTAVVLIDHVPKDKEGRGKGGIGAQHKRAGIDGAGYLLEVVRPMGRGRSGAARITCDKDRGGHVRGRIHDGYLVGEMRVTSRPDDTVELDITARIDAPVETTVRPTTLMERTSRAIEELNAVGVQPTKNQVVADIPGKRTFVLEALKRLVHEGWVEVTAGQNRAQLHQITRPYRTADDPKSEAYQPIDEPPSDLEEM